MYSLRNCFNKTVKYKRKYIRNKTIKYKIYKNKTKKYKRNA